MTVEISYFARVATGGLPIAADPGQDGGPARAQSLSIGTAPVSSNVTPDGQTAVSLIATEAFRYEYSAAGSVAATTTSHYVPAGERFWLTPRSGYRFSLRTA